MAISITLFLPMNFPKLLAEIRKKRGFTQQALADTAGLHVNQIKRYETGASQPTLEALIKLAKSLHVTLDNLVFKEQERGGDQDFQMQFEALSDFTDKEKMIAKELIDSLILKHTANQLAAGVNYQEIPN